MSDDWRMDGGKYLSVRSTLYWARRADNEESEREVENRRQVSRLLTRLKVEKVEGEEA